MFEYIFGINIMNKDFHSPYLLKYKNTVPIEYSDEEEDFLNSLYWTKFEYAHCAYTRLCIKIEDAAGRIIEIGIYKIPDKNILIYFHHYESKLVQSKYIFNFDISYLGLFDGIDWIVSNYPVIYKYLMEYEK